MSLINAIMENTFPDYIDNPTLIKTFGETSKSGIYNTYAYIKEYNKALRARSEVLILQGNKVFLSFKSDGIYKIPGGTWERNVPNIKQAERECMEEVREVVIGTKLEGTYAKIDHEPPKWAINNPDVTHLWYGYYTEVYVAKHFRQYLGLIRKEDKDNIINTGKWYNIKEVYDKLIPYHKSAIDNYMNKGN